MLLNPSKRIIDSPDLNLINKKILINRKFLRIAKSLRRRRKPFLQFSIHKDSILDPHSNSKSLIFLQVDKEIILGCPFIEFGLLGISSEGENEHFASACFSGLDALDEECTEDVSFILF